MTWQCSYCVMYKHIKPCVHQNLDKRKKQFFNTPRNYYGNMIKLASEFILSLVWEAPFTSTWFFKHHCISTWFKLRTASMMWSVFFWWLWLVSEFIASQELEALDTLGKCVFQVPKHRLFSEEPQFLKFFAKEAFHLAKSSLLWITFILCQVSLQLSRGDTCQICT